jgi:exonuclease III
MKSKRTDISSKPIGMKWKTRIGFWNIRTLREYGKLKQVEKEMKNYKLDIMALSEIRWKDNGEIKTQDGNSLIFSGIGEEKEHRDGVGILMSKEA